MTRKRHGYLSEGPSPGGQDGKRRPEKPLLTQTDRGQHSVWAVSFTERQNTKEAAKPLKKHVWREIRQLIGSVI